MFAKLFKYDMKAIKRYALPLLIVLACLTVVGAIDGAVLVKSTENFSDDNAEAFVPNFLFTVSIFSLLFIIFAIVAVGAIAGILVMVEYYKSTVTDEAYLTFTLPVKSKQILMSKTLNGVIWSIVFALASIVSILIIFIVIAISIGPSNYPPDMNVTTSDLGGVGAILFTVFSAVLYAFTFVVNSVLLYFMAITLSSTVTTKHRVLCAIGCVIGINFGYGIINDVIQTIITLIAMAGATVSGEVAVWVTGITMLVRAVFMAGFSVLFFYFTNKMLDKKLNLA